MRSNLSSCVFAVLCVGAIGLTALPAPKVVAETSSETSQLDLIGPTGSTDFGRRVLVLTNGNYVVTDPAWTNPGGMSVGAVHLYDGRTNEIISTLTGSQEGDEVGDDQPVEVGDSNFVVSSISWANGAAENAGAATWINGTVGLSGEVSVGNSLVGTQEDDFVGLGVLPLNNGNYLVSSPAWASGPTADVGAVTWADGNSGVVGAVSGANSLIGSREDDQVGGSEPVPLGNGDAVLGSPDWDNGGVLDAGAVTLIDGDGGSSGTIDASNSLVGTNDGDGVGGESIVEVASGNFVVASPDWGNGLTDNVGAVTWIDRTSGTSGAVSSTNSLVGSQSGDRVGERIVALANGNYVVGSPSWRNGGSRDAGAVTWGDGELGIVGEVTLGNSLVGANSFDSVGLFGDGRAGILALTNGNYVVVSPLATIDGIASAGAVTWADGETGRVGTVDASNSMVGSHPQDRIGLSGSVALPGGDYVVVSRLWDRGPIFPDAGAVTWGDGDIGFTGPLDQTNSLVGGALNRSVGSGGVVVLANGNYVVRSPDWFGGLATEDAGAITWGSGTGGVVGPVSSTNSLIGQQNGDEIGGGLGGGVTALSDGNFVVTSPNWDNGAIEDVGAVTWLNGSRPATGNVSAGNSLVGELEGGKVGSTRAVSLGNGGFAFGTSDILLGNGSRPPVVTWNPGGGTISGVVGADNSFTMAKLVAFNGLLVADPGDEARQIDVGSFLVFDRDFGGGRGAVSFGSADAGLVGSANALNSAIGTVPGGLLRPSTRLTSGDAIVVATRQNRVLLLRLDRPPRLSPPNIRAVVPAGAQDVAVEFDAPVADDVRDGPIESVCVPASGAVFSVGDTDVTCTATDSKGQSSSATFTVTVTPPPDPDPESDVVSLEPARLLDTRASGETVDDRFEKLGKVAAGSFVELDVANRAGVPGDAGSVVLNVTMIRPDGNGFVTIYPCDVDRPLASSMNAPAGGGVVANEVIAKVSANGTVCLYSSVGTNLAADVTGYVPGTSPVVSVEPARLLDTRSTGETDDGRFAQTGKVVAGSFVELEVLGRGGVPSSGVGSVVLNVTMIRPDGNGFVTIYPCDVDRPLASSMNAPAGGGVVANEVIAKVSATGTVCLYSSVGTNLAADVTGFVPDGSGVVSVEPARLLDTRPTGETADDLFAQTGRLAADTEIELDVLGRGGVPSSSVSAVVLNVTMIRPDGNGFVTIYPCDVDRPLASSMNAPAGGGVVANEVIAKVSATGTVCLYSSVGTNLAADVTGYVAT